MRVDLFYLANNTTGGWVTFTAHLYRVLVAVGFRVTLYKIGNQSEGTFRDFGYGIRYRNVTLAEAVANARARIIVAADKAHKTEAAALYASGAHIVVHDPTELKNLPPLGNGAVRCIVDRQAGLKYLPRATFIRHPYVRQTIGESIVRDLHAVALSRVDFDKHTDVIVKANESLPEDRRVQLYGTVNRRYAFLKLQSVFPEWRERIQPYPRQHDAAYRMFSRATFSVDMSLIVGDGGGTQYTTLEAWDAGAVPIIQRRWVRSGDEMIENVNCLCVDTAQELAERLATDVSPDTLAFLRQASVVALREHGPEMVGEAYKHYLHSEVSA
jgi:hypothetical protein